MEEELKKIKYGDYVFRVGDEVKFLYDRFAGNRIGIGKLTAIELRTFGNQTNYHVFADIIPSGEVIAESQWTRVESCIPIEQHEKLFKGKCCENCAKDEYLDLVKFEDKIYCRSCYDEEYFKCSSCANIQVLEDNCYETRNTDLICENCYENHFFTCDNCNEVVHNDDYRDDGLCCSCFDSDEDSEERKYYTGDKYTTKSERIYSAEIEANYPDYSTRQEMMSFINEDVGITHDGSLGNNGVELQTPKISGKKGEELLKDTCNLLNENGFEVDSSCGLHIHLDTKDYFSKTKKDKEAIAELKESIANGEYWFPSGSREKEIKKLIKERTELQKVQKIKKLVLLYLALEDIIYSFVPRSRKSNRFCIPLSENYHSKEIENCDKIDDLEKIWYREDNKDRREQRKKEKYDSSRYSGINFHIMFAQKHLEVRIHSGTINFLKIRNWAKLHIAILDFVIENYASSEYDKLLSDLKLTLELKQKTELLFSKINLTQSTKDYFLERQKTFCGGNLEEQKQCVE